MNSLLRILLLGARVVLASFVALGIQIALLIRSPDYLLTVQEGIKASASGFFNAIQTQSQYHVAYNLIGGDNIVVHTFFVLIAYIAILLILLPFSSRRVSSRRRSRPYR